MATQKTRAHRPTLEVHLDAPELGEAAHIGHLYPASERVDLAPSFAYTQAWLDTPGAQSIDPQLALYTGRATCPGRRDLPRAEVQMMANVFAV